MKIRRAYFVVIFKVMVGPLAGIRRWSSAPQGRPYRNDVCSTCKFLVSSGFAKAHCREKASFFYIPYTLLIKLLLATFIAGKQTIDRGLALCYA